jgi:signal transduction histidine kinase
VLFARFDARVVTLIRLAGLALIAWTVLSAQHSPAGSGRGLVVAISFGLASLASVAWMARPSRVQEISPDVVLMALAGGVLCGASPDSAASAFVFVAAVVAGVRAELRRASLVIAVGVLALAGSVLAFSGSALGLLAYTLGFAAAALAGSNARQSAVRADQAELLLAQQQRSHEEQLRLARLEESARIAREIHDVLAHALAGLVIQLEATSSLLEQGADPESVHDRVHRAYELAREGLQETRDAVGALRGEAPSTRGVLEELVADYRASADAPATLTIDGDPTRLDGAVGRAIARITQEALTNTRKHAPGADVTVTLRAGNAAGEEIVLLVQDRAGKDSRPRAGLAASGGGYGLQGMRERAQLLGGTLSAGAHDGGWRVELHLPAGGEAGS